MSKKPGLYANINAKKDACKMCKGGKSGKKSCRCGKADMGRKGPYADGCGYNKDSVAAEFNSILTNDAERSDKPCGNSYIPQNAKCSKGAGQAKGRSVSEQKKRESVPKDKEYKRLRQLENEMNKEQAKKSAEKSGKAQYEALSDKQKARLIRQQAKPIMRVQSREAIKSALKANKGKTGLENRTIEKAAKRELFNRNVRNVAAAGLYLGALHAITSPPGRTRPRR